MLYHCMIFILLFFKNVFSYFEILSYCSLLGRNERKTDI